MIPFVRYAPGMRKPLWICLAAFLSCGSFCTADVLIVADEFPAMEILSKRLKAEEGITAQLVDQARLPSSLASFPAVVVYIHKELHEPAEHAFIQYARNGGRLVLLHHSISSGKRQNREWFRFLGVELPEGGLDQGGYKYIEGVTVTCVNLAPGEYITSHLVNYPAKVEYRSTRGSEELPAFALNETEVYLNHVLHGPHTLLLGLRYLDVPTGKTWAQQTAGWWRRAEKGAVFYFMPGHSPHDFENPCYGRIILNAITGKASSP
jgi:hypothetical protein